MSLEVKDLTIGYDSDLVKDISFAVQPGQIVTVIGPNGSGKSTLLRTLTGVLAPRGGVVCLDGTDKESMPYKEIARKLSMVATNKVNPELMTCREVIESGRYAYTGMFGRLSDTDRKVVDEAIAATDTAQIALRPFTNISDGQRQRVLLARAIAQEPGVLILDEPTSYLDIRYRMDILLRIRQLAKERGIGILMSVHEPEIAMNLSDTVIAMSDGAIQRIGTPCQVFEEEFIRRLYKLGDSDISLLSVKPWMDADSPKCSPGVIMIAGTMSNVGKSVIAAGLCRVLTRRGYKVSPFKSQNMANNSYVTNEGLEMGRAQVVQAECCKVLPEAYMNPILLKPVSDRGSQVIVNGKPVGNMDAKEYFEYKKELIPVIMDAFDKARSQSDAVVIEGAGSVAEINLRENDIVNMGLADMTKAPVILVGDIDRGGVFAQLIGTLDLLEPLERARIKGLIINKFRGDVALLEPGLGMLEDKAKVPVLGVVPYTDIDIDDEDSLSPRLAKRSFGAGAAESSSCLDIAIVRLPHIANFTDFDILGRTKGVIVRYTDDPADLAGCDAVLLPGTKNTVGDMKWLERSGMGAYLKSYAKSGGIVLGICGGYQMLGNRISDPEGSEEAGSVPGLGLLDVSTIILGEKARKQFEGVFTAPTGALSELSGVRITGYEIHTGETVCDSELSGFTSGGSGYCAGNVYGTYVHGIFDEKSVAMGFLRAVAYNAHKDVDLGDISGRREYIEKQYEHLADVLEENIDIDRILAIMQFDTKQA